MIQSYGVTTPIIAVSNGIDLKKYGKDPRKEEVFRDYFGIEEGQPVVICAGLYFQRKGIEDFVKVAEKMPHVRFIWLGSISKWLIPKKIRDIVNGKHPDNVSFPGYFKGAVFQGAMSGANAFFFPSYEETEGIVVLEAFASHQHVVLRDIPVYEGWVDDKSASFGHNVDEFVVPCKILSMVKWTNVKKAIRLQKVARLMMSPKSLLKPTKKYWRFKCVSDCLQIPIFHRYQVLRPVFAR